MTDTIEPGQGQLFTLANILGRNLRGPLQKWVQGGQYGTLFDNVEDNLTFARFQTFDFQGISAACFPVSAASIWDYTRWHDADGRLKRTRSAPGCSRGTGRR